MKCPDSITKEALNPKVLPALGGLGLGALNLGHQTGDIYAGKQERINPVEAIAYAGAGVGLGILGNKISKNLPKAKEFLNNIKRNVNEVGETARQARKTNETVKNSKLFRDLSEGKPLWKTIIGI